MKDGKKKAAAVRGSAPAASTRLALLLVLLTLLPAVTFWSVRSDAFITYDDPEYVPNNPVVGQGLTWPGVRWAFTTGTGANWFPLTWLSHMADVSLFGIDPSGHHTTNLLLHVANTLLLFLLLRRLTGEDWKSAWVAALFAVHPAHVESVAWVAERKDLLSGLFWLATTMAYVSWVRRRGAGRYALMLAFFAAGLMSKPMLVSLPLTLLLLDTWPLERLGGGNSLRSFLRLSSEGRPGLVLEKVPLFLMAAASSVVTFLVQRAGGAVRSLEAFPFPIRLANALVAYVRYLGKLVWPARLAVFYPHPGASLSAALAAAAALCLLALSAAAFILRRKASYLFTGWFWFLVTMLPVIGLVQVGYQALADRYTYIPFVGLFVAIAWGVPALLLRWRPAPVAMRAAAVLSVFALAVTAAAQLRYWRNSETLYLRTLEVTKNNSTIENNLGDFYNETGRPEKAMPYLSDALRIKPGGPEIENNVGRSLYMMGRYPEAEQHFRRSLSRNPQDPITLNNLARVRFIQGDVQQAVGLYRAAAAAKPDAAEVRMRLGIALFLEGNVSAAREELERASLAEPGNANYRALAQGVPAFEKDPSDPAAAVLRQRLAAAHQEVGGGLQSRGKSIEALAHFRRAVELAPSSPGARIDLGAQLTRTGHLEEGQEEFVTALKIEPGSALAHTDLGYVLYLRGQRDAAIGQYREALRLQPGFPLAQTNLELALRTGAGEDKPPVRP
jgi:tetratricopeptide (TPR) repeat protein